MPGNYETESDFDPQDQAEALDESMTVGGEGSVGLGGESPFAVGEEMRTFEELPELLDLTQAVGDRDDDEALALDADEFDEAAIGDSDFEEDNELDYRAATEEHEDDLDGLGAEDSYDEDELEAGGIEGLDEEVLDADAVSGGEDDFTNFQSRGLADDDLKRMGYAEERDGQVRARPDED
jgi:hypothetical protein